MIVDCPGCAARYRLAGGLLGSAGGRVRCPRCGERFVVARIAADSEVAREAALGVLAGRAALLAEAAAHGRLFAEHGAALCDAFDAYLAAGGDAAQFRRALERRHGVTLASRAPQQK